MHANRSRRRTASVCFAALLVTAALSPRARESSVEAGGTRRAASAAAQRGSIDMAPRAADAWGEGRRWGLCLGWMAASGLATAIGTAAGGPLGGIVVLGALLPPLLEACA